MLNLYRQINKKLFLAFMSVVFFVSGTPAFGYSDRALRENAIVKAIRKVSPAVVNISSEYEVTQRTNPFPGLEIDPFFDSFFKDFFDSGIERRQKRSSLGSGVIIDGRRGFILTNAHVIEKTGIIMVILKDEREFEAQIVGADPDSDLAVLQITSDTRLPDIEMGDSEDIMIGETVIAIGNPFGFSNTVTTGVVSATNRSIRAEDRVYHDFIQIDASINPGNSGGPLLNITGELIGINTAIYAKAQGIGFAIPINKARRIISDLIQYGEVIPAWIGIDLQDMDTRLAQYLNASGIKGIIVKHVDSPGPARQAGIQEGDILLKIGRKKVYSFEDYRYIMRDYSAGDTIDLQLWRNGKKIKVTVMASVFPDDYALDRAYRLLGIKVENLSLQNRIRYQTHSKQGVVITQLNRQSYLAQIGSQPGDIIRQIDQVTISDMNDFKKAIAKYHQKTSVVLLLQRRDQLYYITVRL